MGRPKQFDPELAVERAMDVFWRQGYGATTPQDLTDALGIGKGSLYHAFGSKRELFDRALERYRGGASAELVEHLRRPGPVKPLIRAAFELVVARNFAEWGRRGCLAVNTATELAAVDAASAEQVRGLFDRTEGAFRDAIERGQRSGEIAADVDAAAVAGLLMAMLTGIQVLVKSAAGPERFDGMIDAAMRSL